MSEFVGGVNSSTNVGLGFLEDWPPAMMRFSLPPSRCSVAAVRAMPYDRATLAAADHNSAGIGLTRALFFRHCSNRACTSSIVSASDLLPISSLHAGPCRPEERNYQLCIANFTHPCRKLTEHPP